MPKETIPSPEASRLAQEQVGKLDLFKDKAWMEIRENASYLKSKIESVRQGLIKTAEDAVAAALRKLPKNASSAEINSTAKFAAFESAKAYMVSVVSVITAAKAQALRDRARQSNLVTQGAVKGLAWREKLPTSLKKLASLGERKGYVLAEDALKAGLKIQEVAVKGGRLIRFVRIGARVCVVAVAALSVYDAYDQATKLNQMLSQEYSETGSVLGAMSAISNYGESLAAQERKKDTAQGIETIQESNLNKKLKGARDITRRLTAYCANYGVSRNKSSGDSVWSQLEDGAAAALGAPTYGAMALVYGGNDSKLRQSERTTINANVEQSEQVLIQLEAIENPSSEAIATVKALKAAIDVAKWTLENDRKIPQATIDSTVEKTRDAVLYRKIREARARFKTMRSNLEKRNIPEHADAVNSLLALIDQVDNGISIVTEENWDKYKSSMIKIEKEYARLMGVEEEEKVVEIPVPGMVHQKVKYQIRAKLYSGVIKYQGVDYRYNYDRNIGNYWIIPEKGGAYGNPKGPFWFDPRKK